MELTVQNPVIKNEVGGVRPESLFRIGGIAGVIAALLFLSDIIVMLTGGSIPGSAGDWFSLMQANKGLGLLMLFFSDVVGIAILIPFVYSLYVLLRRSNIIYSALAVILFLVGSASVFSTNSNYMLVYLNDQYAQAATQAVRAQILAASEPLFAGSMWSTGFLMAGLLLEGALVIISILMLRSGLFHKGIAYTGILGHGLDCLHSIILLALIPLLSPAQASSIANPLLIVGGTIQLIWYPLVARRLLQLGK